MGKYTNFRDIKNAHAQSDDADQIQIVKIKASIEDIMDYAKYKQHFHDNGPILNPLGYLYNNITAKLYAKTAQDIESEHAHGSFNEFIYYRHFTSKIADSDFKPVGVKYVADISGLDLSQAGPNHHPLNLTWCDFDEVYAIGTIFDNTELELASFKNAIMICSVFNGTKVPYANFSRANLSYATIGDTVGDAIYDSNTIFPAHGEFSYHQDLFSSMPALPSFTRSDVMDKINHSVDMVCDKAHQVIDSASDAVAVVAYNASGAVMGGIGGFTAANIAMAVAVPAIGPVIGFNLSAAGVCYGAIEGYRYYSGSDNSLILSAKNKVYSIFESPKDKTVINLSTILGGDGDNVKYDDKDITEYSQAVEQILRKYQHTPNLEIQTIIVRAMPIEGLDDEYFQEPVNNQQLVLAHANIVDISDWEVIQNEVEAHWPLTVAVVEEAEFSDWLEVVEEMQIVAYQAPMIEAY